MSDELRAEVRRRLAARKSYPPANPAPRYDSVFFEGTAALDAMARGESGYEVIDRSASLNRVFKDAHENIRAFLAELMDIERDGLDLFEVSRKVYGIHEQAERFRLAALREREERGE